MHETINKTIRLDIKITKELKYLLCNDISTIECIVGWFFGGHYTSIQETIAIRLVQLYFFYSNMTYIHVSLKFWQQLNWILYNSDIKKYLSPNQFWMCLDSSPVLQLHSAKYFFECI